MSITDKALRERIKELTCLYDVSSIIVNADADYIEDTLTAIAFSLKKAFQFGDDTEIIITTQTLNIKTSSLQNDTVFITSEICLFNVPNGKIEAHLRTPKFSEQDFLNEEQLLLNSVALKVGSLLERIEIQNSETSLKRQMERADRLSILGEITAGIAHELNTPLANILGFAELLKDQLDAKNSTTRDLDKIIENAIFSREVVKKLMFFACEMPQEMTRVNLVPHIKNAIDLLDATFRKEQVKYVVKIEDDILLLKADPIQLTQIIFNLLINAIYFSPVYGLVTVTAYQTKRDIVLKISDEGIGFQIEDLDKIFQPFFTTKPIGDGAGLGLSVVHGIVASHKGKISAENNKNKGAIFTVMLPKE
ncbi:sensor histidine kinase [Psychroserpens damuponensis]|uniref:sensor histidine kinase n=1 Tax=Psychroserpens damuponensis TaxID=943936 RepID=UPI00058B20A6|nr:ATP-binding protein [Psychroserpens damuponensis]